MKLNYELTNRDKILIRVLDYIGGVTLKRLYNIINDVSVFEDKDLDGIIKYFCDIHKEKNENYLNYSFDYFKKTYIEKLNNESIVLERFGILKRTEDSQSLMRNPDIETIKLELTNYGIELAKKVTQNLRIMIRPPISIKKQAFIACAFGNSQIDKLCDNEIEPILKDLGFELFRVDTIEPEQTVTDAIIDNITKSFCLIADLTFARPSVYFEIGIALGLGIPIILTCRKDHQKGTKDELKVHFDLEQFKISFWDIKDELFNWEKSKELKIRIEKLITDFGYKIKHLK
jgi:nucleoside 2-deoxyribosyltransferase